MLEELTCLVSLWSGLKLEAATKAGLPAQGLGWLYWLAQSVTYQGQ